MILGLLLTSLWQFTLYTAPQRCPSTRFWEALNRRAHQVQSRTGPLLACRPPL